MIIIIYLFILYKNPRSNEQNNLKLKTTKKIFFLELPSLQVVH